MIVYSKYVDGIDYCWYDSSNVLFSKCYDNPTSTKPIKVVFKNGRTYMYRNVDPNDYVLFKNEESTGSAFNKYLKKYDAVRIGDTDLEGLEKLKESFIEGDTEVSETKMSDLMYKLEVCELTGEFVLSLRGKPLYSGIEGQVSIINLLKSLNINCMIESVDKVIRKTDENEEKIDLGDGKE